MPAEQQPQIQDAEADARPHADGAPYADLGYEAARDALTDVVRRLEAGNLTLEDSLALWERGEALADVCQQRLEGARARLAEALDAPEAPTEA